MTAYKLKSGLSLDGVIHSEGDIVELSAEQYNDLSDIVEVSEFELLPEELDDAPASKPYAKMRNDELIAIMETMGIGFDPNGTKKQFIANIEAYEETKESLV